MLKRHWKYILAVPVLAALALSGHRIAVSAESPPPRTKLDRQIERHAQQTLAEGRDIFRFDTFGDEAFWGDTLKLHQAITGEPLGGVGAGVSPKTAWQWGSRWTSTHCQRGSSGAGGMGGWTWTTRTTLELLSLNAVIGVNGFFDAQHDLHSIGIHCAFCHSTVDDSLAPGIGSRLDGWANRDLNVGAIIDLAPDLSPSPSCSRSMRRPFATVLTGWGPGKFDAALNLDGKGFRPDGKTAATLIPPAFGLAGRQSPYVDRLGLGHALEHASSPSSRCTARERSSTRA